LICAEIPPFRGNGGGFLIGSTKITIENARRLVGDCVLFRELNPDQRNALVRSAHLRTVAGGEAIFLMGDPGDSMMAVLTGTVRISAPSPDGKEIILGLMQPGEFFGELALLDGKERSADAKAMTDCTLAILNRRDVLQFLDRNPAGWPSMIEVLCERLRRTTVQITEVALLELPVRLAKALLRLTATAGDMVESIKLSQRELGNIVGATRESVNKCMREWQRNGTIRIEGNSVRILDRAHLQAIADAVED
jgi:CRP/FNR family transcriptional regulator, cyclic AMP receptor protein